MNDVNVPEDISSIDQDREHAVARGIEVELHKVQRHSVVLSMYKAISLCMATLHSKHCQLACKAAAALAPSRDWWRMQSWFCYLHVALLS